MPTHRPADGAKDAQERRQMRRIDAARDVLFAADDSVSGPLRRGLATDISAGGLRIECRFPEKAGTHIHIEMQPIPGDRAAEVLFYRGRIMHVSRSENGASAMGVRFVDKTNGSRTGSLRTTSTPLAKPYEGVRRGNSDPERGSIEAALSESNPRARRKRRFLPFILLFLRTSRIPRLVGATIFLAGLLAAWTLRTGEANTPAASGSAAFSDSSDSFISRVSATSPTKSAVEARSRDADSRKTDPAPLSIHESVWERNSSLDGILSDIAISTEATAEFVDELARVESMSESGDQAMAQAHLDAALANRRGVADAWVRVAREYRQASLTGILPAELLPETEAFDMEPAHPDTTVAVGIRLEVDTGNRVLRVMDGERLLRDYPVGIGKDGTTPRGNFMIANMLTNPDWHNRGKIVPAESPDNPLGSRWMGLGRNGRPTRYGIHGTNEPQSIGGAYGRGCIRMRTSDAEALFQWCSPGTPVEIR